MKHNISITTCVPVLVLLLVLVLAFVIGLTGFSLAQPGASDFLGKDRLIGAFVTTEYLDLFDMDRYFNDNIGKMATGGDIAIDGDSTKYQGRLYATLKERSNKNEDTGEIVTTQEYTFEDIDGMEGLESVDGTSYFCYTISNKNGTYSSVSGGEGISDGHTSISTTDNGEDISLDGTIYVAPTSNNVTFYINPVYQSTDGRVYAMSGSGISFSGSTSEGAAFSKTLDETNTIIENGETNIYSISAKISISVMYPPQRIFVLQFGLDGELLSRDEYLPGTLPETITPMQRCSYIVLESYKTSPEKGEAVTRSLYQTDDDTLESFYCRDDGICVKQYTALNWIP